jgi:hypothetical protein
VQKSIQQTQLFFDASFFVFSFALILTHRISPILAAIMPNGANSPAAQAAAQAAVNTAVRMLTRT